MTAIADNLAAVRDRIAAVCLAVGRQPREVELVAVSKHHPATAVCAAHAAGQCAFGENRVQELVAKAAEVADLTDLRWHMIGSLQTNKVRDLLRVPGLALVHSLDREGLADALQRELASVGRRLQVLMQINATGEEAKHGCEPDRAVVLLDHVRANCPDIIVRGLMAMGPLEGDPRPTFESVARVRLELAERHGGELPILSLGMSDDLEAAIEAGSTLVRIGTAVFGSRG